MRPLIYGLLTMCLLNSNIDSAANSQTRIERPSQRLEQVHFSGITPGISIRWWRKFRNPAFCPFIICNGSCADISGQARIGSYSSDELVSDLTPCSLNSEWIDASSGSCCMNRTISKSYEAQCGDGCCSRMGK